MGASPALVAVAPTHEWRYIGSTSTLARAMWPLAPHDLDVARRLQQAEDFDWAALAAQQAAEKAAKAVLLHAGLPADPTHNIRSLFGALVTAGVASREAVAALRLPI